MRRFEAGRSAGATAKARTAAAADRRGGRKAGRLVGGAATGAGLPASGAAKTDHQLVGQAGARRRKLRRPAGNVAHVTAADQQGDPLAWRLCGRAIRICCG